MAELSGVVLPILEVLEGESRARAFAMFTLLEAELHLNAAKQDSVRTVSQLILNS
jgi:hypothetical protein